MSWVENDVVTIHGTNVISTILDGKVIQEHFEINSGNSIGFKGTSISVFNPKTKIWKQAWDDNQGGYNDFTGIIDRNKRIFTTQIKEKDGKQNVLLLKEMHYLYSSINRWLYEKNIINIRISVFWAFWIFSI